MMTNSKSQHLRSSKEAGLERRLLEPKTENQMSYTRNQKMKGKDICVWLVKKMHTMIDLWVVILFCFVLLLLLSISSFSFFIFDYYHILVFCNYTHCSCYFFLDILLLLFRLIIII